MALFRKPRRQRPTAPSEPIAPSGPRASTPTEALREHLAEIAAAAAVPEDALEPALTAVLEASRAQAGALCVFDPRHQILRLVSEVGLSDEGCRRLRSVRRADPTAWDMPLHGLLNRRAYLIESAARNRYVPRLVEQQATVRTVACMPLYAGPIPVGSLVLIALAPRSLSERDIHSLERAVGELAAIIEAVRRRAGVEEERAAPPPRR
jgi:GAF domain-containing protein